MKTVKTVKKANTAKPKAQKKFKETREDVRQKARVAAIVKEARSVLSKIEALRRVIDSDRFRDMPSIDRHIVAVMFSALGSYAAALSMKADWENVRLRTPSGDRLNASASKFVQFLVGEPAAARFRKLEGADAKKV